MAWTELTRCQHDRRGDKYASDMKDAEWALIAPSMPPPKRTGRPRRTCLRDVVDALLNTLQLHCNDVMPMAYVAQRLPAGFNSSGVFLRVAR
jgi:hypothetical protein